MRVVDELLSRRGLFYGGVEFVARLQLPMLVCVVAATLNGPATAVAADVTGQAIDLTCKPQQAVTEKPNDPIVAIKVSVRNDVWSITHIAASGASYERSSQYRMKDVSTAAGRGWSGNLINRSNLRMAGTLSLVGGVPTYTETLFDDQKSGEIVFVFGGPCSVDQPRRLATKSIVQPSIEVQSAQPPTDCSEIADNSQRLACYDAKFGRQAPKGIKWPRTGWVIRDAATGAIIYPSPHEHVYLPVPAFQPQPSPFQVPHLGPIIEQAPLF
jgi:hypothetical protein